MYDEGNSNSEKLSDFSYTTQLINDRAKIEPKILSVKLRILSTAAFLEIFFGPHTSRICFVVVDKVEEGTINILTQKTSCT